MSYATVYVPPGLGLTSAEQLSRARRENDRQGLSQVQVGPGYWDDWLDAALEPSGIPGTEASRVPTVVREVLEANGNEVDRVAWGGGQGLETIRGKIYVKWKPTRPYNAVTYADIARRIFMSAADQFPAGARLTMHRYRIPAGTLPTWLGGEPDRFVYPEGGPVPASAPAAAQRTTVEDIPPPATDLTPTTEQQASGTIAPALIAGLAIGGSVIIGGGGYLYYRYGRKRVRRNRRRRRRTSR